MGALRKHTCQELLATLVSAFMTRDVAPIGIPNADVSMRILIIEDDDRIAKPLAEYLRRQHHIVDITTDGLEGWEWSQSGLYELILLDIMMPGIDGFETCSRLKSNPSTSGIPIIFMTALGNTDQKVKGLSLGAVDYITKPFQKEEVLARIQVHLELRNLAKDLATKNQLKC